MSQCHTGGPDSPFPYRRGQDIHPERAVSMIRSTTVVDRNHTVPASNEQASNFPPVGSYSTNHCRLDVTAPQGVQGDAVPLHPLPPQAAQECYLRSYY